MQFLGPSLKKKEYKITNEKLGTEENIYLRPLPGPWGHAVVQLVEALPYKPEGRGFDSRWCHWNFSLT